MLNIDPETMFIQRRLSGVVRQLNGIVKNLEEFGVEHPSIVAPNLLDAILGNLKDDINILLREVNILGSPNRRTLEKRRYVCRSCSNMFPVPLVAGICDECRSRGITTTEVFAAISETEKKSASEETADDDQSARNPDESLEEAPEAAPEKTPEEAPETGETQSQPPAQSDDPLTLSEESASEDRDSEDPFAA